MRAFIGVLGVFLGLVFCAVAIVRMTEISAPRLLIPASQQVSGLLAEAQTQSAAQSGADHAEHRARLLAEAAAVALSHPLDPLPYSVLQIQALKAGDDTLADRAANAALSIQPRSRAARMHLANRALKSGDVRLAIEEVTRLSQVDPDGVTAYADIVVSLSRYAEGKQAITEALADNPNWKEAALTKLAAESNDFAFLQEIFAYWPKRLGLVMSRMVEDGRFEQAYLLFLSSLPSDSAITVPYDQTFQGAPGDRPFNWLLKRRNAVISRDGSGLAVTYFGRGRELLAGQVVPIGTGQYRFAVELSGRPSAEAGEFLVRSRCRWPGGDDAWQVTEISLADFAAGGMSTEFDYSDGDCRFAQIEFLAFPGQFPQLSEFKITSVSLDRIERS